MGRVTTQIRRGLSPAGLMRGWTLALLASLACFSLLQGPLRSTLVLQEEKATSEATTRIAVASSPILENIYHEDASQKLAEMGITSSRGMHFLTKTSFWNGNHNDVYSLRKRRRGYIYRIGGFSREGFGAFFQHCKSSIVLSMFLGLDLFFDNGTRSQHGYNVARVVNGPEFKAYGPLISSPSVCSLNSLLLPHNPGIENLMGKMCESMFGMNKFDFDPLRKAMDNCTVFLHEISTKETHEDFNDCVQPFYFRKFTAVFPKAIKGAEIRASLNLIPNLPPAPPGTEEELLNLVGSLIDAAATGEEKRKIKPWLNVGVHIRWGDLKVPNRYHRPVNFTMVNEVARKLHVLYGNTKDVRIYLFLEKGDPEVTSKLQFKFTLVKTPSDFLDLYVFSLMDVYVMSTSTFAVLASLIHPPWQMKTVITDDVKNNKFNSPYVKWNHVYSYEAKNYGNL